MNVMLRMRNQEVCTVYKARYVTAPTAPQHFQFPHFLLGIHVQGQTYLKLNMLSTQNYYEKNTITFLKYLNF